MFASPGRLVLTWVLGLIAIGAAVPAASRAERTPRSRYVLEATLDPKTHVVHGVLQLRWINSSRVPLDVIYLHLYLNAFRDTGTVFFRESGPSFRGVPHRGSGGIEIEALQTRDGQDLLPRTNRELIPGDQTQMRVSLHAPVAPGEGVDLMIQFRSMLPEGAAARSGYVRDFHMVAQWFPKPARVERDGTWATFPYHGFGEFYSDFADYDVTLHMPKGFRVGATGQLVESDPAHDRMRFVAEQVHDFAFTAWPHFREHKFEHAGVHVRILYPPGHRDSIAGHAKVVADGLDSFGRDYGVYPYPTLTVVIPPHGADGAAGMEYPTLIASWNSWWGPRFIMDRALHTTAHELAHEWFYGLVASNEVAHPFLDEGLTQFAGESLLRKTRAPSVVDNFQISRTMLFWSGSDLPSAELPASAYRDRSSYGRGVYARTSLALETIRRVWGPARLTATLRAYATAFRFQHPTPDDLCAAFDAHYWDGFCTNVWRPLLTDERPADARIDDLESEREGHEYVTTFSAHREGRATVPLLVRLYSNSRVVRDVWWTSSEPVLRASFRSSEPITDIALDPTRSNLLDPSTLDNTLTRRSTRSHRPLLSRMLQGAFALLAGLGP